ncbi:MAG: twin-arginine translocase subunit TatC [Pseudomonadota bacterium]
MDDSQLQKPDEPERLQTLYEHLGDLRVSLFRSVIAIILTFFGCFHFAESIVIFLKKPILEVLPENQKQLYYFGLTEQLYSYIKVSLVAALLFSSPFLFLQIWLFVKPALKNHERKLALPFVLAAFLAFLLGFFVAYQWVLPYLFNFLLTFGASGSEMPMLGLADYLTLTLQILLGTALFFEIPVLLSLLGRLGIINGAILKQFRPQAYIGLAIVAAVVTPTPDAFTMILALVPLFVLYEISVFAVTVLSKK